MTPDFKPKQPLDLDFLSPYSLDECRQRLATQQEAGIGFRVYTGDEGRFTVEWGQRGTWPRSSDAAIALTFVGYLEPATNGTRVQGSVTPHTRTTVHMTRQAAIILAIITAITLIASAVITLPGGVTTLTILGLGSVVLGIYTTALHHQMGQLCPWVENKLKGTTDDGQTEKEAETPRAADG